MKVTLRVYKRFDTDLIALAEAGAPLSLMCKEAVSAIANGRAVHFYIDQPVFFDLNNKQNIKINFTVKNSDAATIKLLKSIKHGYISSFCKAALRNSLVQQNICAFFSTPDMVSYQVANLNSTNLNAFHNLKPLSTVKEMLKDENKQLSLQNMDNKSPLPIGPILYPGYGQPIFNYQLGNSPAPQPVPQAETVAVKPSAPAGKTAQEPNHPAETKPQHASKPEIPDKDTYEADISAVAKVVQGRPIQSEMEQPEKNDDVIEAAQNDNLLDLFMKL